MKYNEMMWASAGALIGFLFGSWQGLLIGAAIGYAIIAGAMWIHNNVGKNDANTFVGPPAE